MTLATPREHERLPTLRARRLGLFTQHEPIVLMRTDCHVCRSEGLSPRAQVLLSSGERQVYATLFQISGELIAIDEAALSEAAWTLLGVAEGARVEVRHAPPLASMASVRRRIYGNRLDEPALQAIVGDVAAGRYTDVHLAAFLTATSALPLDDPETLALTKAMVDVGDHLARRHGRHHGDARAGRPRPRGYAACSRAGRGLRRLGWSCAVEPRR